MRRQVQTWVTDGSIEVIVLNGGTGIAPRDTTYEAIAALLSKTLPGFGEIFRLLSYEEIGSRAMASRAIAGVCDATLILSLPGSSKAVELAMNKLLLPELVHLTTQMRGQEKSCFFIATPGLHAYALKQGCQSVSPTRRLPSCMFRIASRVRALRMNISPRPRW